MMLLVIQVTLIVDLKMSLAVKCQYLGKIVADMAALTFDSRRRVCNVGK